MLGLGLGYAGIRIGTCWDWDMLGLELGYGWIAIEICWDWNCEMLG
jgi:hypothetical protein